MHCTCIIVLTNGIVIEIFCLFHEPFIYLLQVWLLLSGLVWQVCILSQMNPVHCPLYVCLVASVLHCPDDWISVLGSKAAWAWNSPPNEGGSLIYWKLSTPGAKIKNAWTYTSAPVPRIGAAVLPCCALHVVRLFAPRDLWDCITPVLWCDAVCSLIPFVFSECPTASIIMCPGSHLAKYPASLIIILIGTSGEPQLWNQMYFVLLCFCLWHRVVW